MVKFWLENGNIIESSVKMMVFLDKSLVFFAVPKTASTAFHRALGSKANILFSNSPQMRHIRPKQFNSSIAPFVLPLMPAPLTSIAVIREPIEWIGSWYRYRQRLKFETSPSSTRNISFDTFIEGYLSDAHPTYAEVGQQSIFITGGTEKPLVTQLWRYDAISDLTLFLNLHLGIKFELEQVNVSPKRELELSDQNHAALKAHFAKDFDLYENAIGG